MWYKVIYTYQKTFETNYLTLGIFVVKFDIIKFASYGIS